MNYYDDYDDFAVAKTATHIVRKNGQPKSQQSKKSGSPSIYSSKHVRIQASKISK